MKRLHDAGEEIGKIRIGEAVQKKTEFVSAQPGERVGLSENASEAGRHADQQEVSPLVAQTVVDRFESVQIENADGKFFFRPEGAPVGLFDALLEDAAVRKVGQDIVGGEVKNSVLILHVLRDVGKNSQIVRDLPVRFEGIDRKPFAIKLPRFLPVPDFPLPMSVPGKRLPHPGVEFRGLAARFQEGRGFPEDLSPGVARDLGEGRVHVNNDPGAIGDDDSLPGFFEKKPIAFDNLPAPGVGVEGLQSDENLRPVRDPVT